MADLLTELTQLKRRVVTNKDALRDCEPMASLLIRLIAYVIGEQQPGGWVLGNKFAPLANAHMLRVFSSMGVRLDDEWRFFEGDKGNLSRIVDRLILLYRHPAEVSLFGEDFWDDCYVMLAIVTVMTRDKLTADQQQFVKLHRKEIVEYLSDQATSNFAQVEHGSWYGPGLHSAGIILFDALVDAKLCNKGKAEKVFTSLVKGIIDLLPRQNEWAPYAAWHAGQVLSMYRRLVAKRPSEIEPLAPHIHQLEQDLLSWQDLDPDSPTYGGWVGGGMSDRPANIVYNTVRALGAIYDRDPAAYASPAAVAAHQFLLNQEHAESPMQSLKGAVNTIEVLNDLCRLRLPIRDVGLLIGIDARLERFGLKSLLLGDIGKSDTDTLRKLQDHIREQIEDRGADALEPMGANGRILKDLRGRETLLAEFGEDTNNDLDDYLKRFLSATMTETRANAARNLIGRLWTHAGYFDFLRLFKRLSDLEYKGAFFDRYRDHTNHQLLVFLLGAYVYYNNARLRDLLNKEIVTTSKSRGVVIATDEEAEREFLFRWKLASNFHDVGYIFEVSPSAADPAKQAKELIDQSFNLLEEFRANFLPDLLARHIEDPIDPASLAALPIAEYPKLGAVEDLEVLTTKINADSFAKTSAFLPESWKKADLIRNYYEMCRDNVTDGAAYKPRPAFLDHGIMSALVLLKVVDVQRHYLQQLKDLAGEGALNGHPAIVEMVGTLGFNSHLQEARYARFDHVAGAIALHNIYPKLYGQATCAKHGLEKLFYSAVEAERFQIQPAYALAYLLAFTDALQDWDRHSFRHPTFDESGDAEPLAAPEILIVARDAEVIAVGLTTAAKKRYAQRKQEMALTLASLDEYLSVQTSAAPA